jgi:hypothetical protein
LLSLFDLFDSIRFERLPLQLRGLFLFLSNRIVLKAKYKMRTTKTQRERATRAATTASTSIHLPFRPSNLNSATISEISQRQSSNKNKMECFHRGNSLLVCLPDGREANIETEAGANDILPHLGGFIVQMAIQDRLGKVTDVELVVYYDVIGRVAMHCSPDAFQTHLTPKQLDCWIGYLVKTFKQIAKDVKWTQAGEMKGHHRHLLVMPAAYFNHQNFVKRVSEVKALFLALAKMFGALQSPMVLYSHRDVIGSFLYTVHSLFQFAAG